MAGVARDLGQQIIKLMAAFPDARRDGKLTMVVYAEALDGVAVPAVEAAVSRSIRECKFLPSAAELREFAAAHALALEAAARAVDGQDTDSQAMWRRRVAGWHNARQQGRKGYWPDTWGPRPDDHECDAPNEILSAFGLVRPPAPRRMPAAQLERVMADARRALGEMDTARKPEAPPADTPGQRLVRELAAQAGREWHEANDAKGRAA